MLWLDIHASNGSRLGPGPLITATGWQCKRALDRAGEFSFSLPLADPRASYLQAFRTVRAWDMVNGVQRELGSGTIKRMEATISATGADMLTVLGPDILEELSRVAVGDLQVFDVVTEHPATAFHVHAVEGNTVLTNALDGAAGDTATWATTHIDWGYAGEEFIEIRHTHAFHGLQLRFGPRVNQRAGPELYVRFWDPKARDKWGNPVGDWVALSGIEDGTNRAAEYDEPIHLGQDGTIYFTAPPEWVAVAGLYRLRLSGDDIGDYTPEYLLDIADIAVVYETPTATALAKIMAFAPAGWSLDAAHGLTATENTVYWQAAGESVLECLVRIAELTGEHFSAGYSGRQVIWWGTAQEVAPLRAVGGPGLDGLAIEDNANVCLITRLSEILDAYGLATRVTPTGAGTGDARITLADISDPLPNGYSLDSDTLVRDDAETALGRIEKRLDCPDVEALDNSLEQRQYAANALLKQAYEWLKTHSATNTNRLTGDMPRAYTLAVVGADAVLWPNHQIRTVYRALRDGVLFWDVDDYLTILSATTEYSGDGLRTVALEVATVQTQTDNDALNALQIKRDARAMRAHGANPVGTVLIGPSSGLDMTSLGQVFDADYTPASHALDTAASQHVGGVGLHTHAGPDSTGGQVAHSVLSGLTTGDPHTQYLNTPRHTAIGDAAPHHAAVTLATDHGLSLTGQVLALGTPGTLTSATTNAVTTTTHTHAITDAPALLGNADAQYKTIISGATPFAPVFSSFLLDGTAGGKTVFAVTSGKTLTLTATNDYNLTVPATGTALVKSGALTAGYIPFGVAGNLVGEDQGLFWDNTNKRLGIGTTSLTYKIQVSGGESTWYNTMLITTSATTGSGISIESTDTGGKKWNIISTGSSNSGGAGNIYFYNGTDSNLYMKGSRIGLGGTIFHAAGVTYQCLNVAGSVLLVGASSTQERELATFVPSFAVSTDASRTARIIGNVYDAAGAREWLRGEASGSAAMVGFLGSAAVVCQTGHAAPTDLATALTFCAAIRTALQNYGLITTV